MHKPIMMAEDGGLGMMHPSMALTSVSLVGGGEGVVSVTVSPAALSTHDSSAYKVSCYNYYHH